jgi:hypothetical protein
MYCLQLNTFCQILTIWPYSVPHDFDFSSLYRLYLPNDSRPFGFMIPSVVAAMPWTSGFLVSHETRTIQLFDGSAGKDTAKSINEAFQSTIDAAIEKDVFPIIHQTHSEPFLLMGTKYDAPVYLERFAAPLFGIGSRGAHMTAYVRVPSTSLPGGEEIKIWIARRSKTLFTYVSCRFPL